MRENNLYAKKLFYLYYSKIIFLGEVGHNKEEQSELNYCKYLTCSQNDRFWKTWAEDTFFLSLWGFINVNQKLKI